MTDSSLLIYGQSGSGKSSIGAELVKLARAAGRTVRVLLAEESLPLRKLMNSVLDPNDVWDITSRNHPFETIRLAVDGYWAQDPRDPKSKLASTNADFWVFEGAATIAELLMGSTVEGGLAARYGRGMEIGQEEKTVRFTDGKQQIGGNPRTHYGVVQRWVLEAMAISRRLPGVKLWTTHELRVSDERTSLPIVGPEIIGEAKTRGDAIPRLFGSMFHTELIIKANKLSWALHLGPHSDAAIQTIICRAKTQMPSSNGSPFIGQPEQIAKALSEHLQLDWKPTQPK